MVELAKLRVKFEDADVSQDEQFIVEERKYRVLILLLELLNPLQTTVLLFVSNIPSVRIIFTVGADILSFNVKVPPTPSNIIFPDPLLLENTTPFVVILLEDTELKTK